MSRRGQIISESEIPIFFDLPYAARLLGVSVEGLKKRAQRGQLSGAFKIGKNWRICKNTFFKAIKEVQNGDF